jgi:hypothetical protein
LPSPSAQATGSAVWGPILGWCILQQLAESLDADHPERAALDLPAVALDVFDRLRLREPFARAFAALGFEGEESWRVAARIKILLLAECNASQPAVPVTPEAAPAKPAPLAPADDVEVLNDFDFTRVDEAETSASGHDVSHADTKEASERLLVHAEAPSMPNEETSFGSSPMSEHEFEPAQSLPKDADAPKVGESFVSGHDFRGADKAEEIPGASAPAEPISTTLWLDPDVRWLTGAHEAEGHVYIIREQYEELLWWLQLPSLLKLAVQPSLDRAAIGQLGGTVQFALSTVEAAGYKIDLLVPSTGPKLKTDLSS